MIMGKGGGDEANVPFPNKSHIEFLVAKNRKVFPIWANAHECGALIDEPYRYPAEHSGGIHHRDGPQPSIHDFSPQFNDPIPFDSFPDPQDVSDHTA